MDIKSNSTSSGKVLLFLGFIFALVFSLPESVVAVSEKIQPINDPKLHDDWQWSGNFQVGYATMQSTDQLSAESENANTQDINDEADQYRSDLLAPLFDFTYRRSDQKEMYYFRVPVETGLPLTIGYAIDWQRIGVVDVSAFTKLNRAVWKNPYLQDEPRESTSVQDRGVTLQVNDFFYSYETIDIGDDEIGRVEKALRRDGNTQAVGYSPKISLDNNKDLQIKLVVAQDNMTGKSEQARNTSLKFIYSAQYDRYKWVLDATVNASDYREKHILFQRKRDAVGYAGTAMFTWMHPFGYKDLFNTWIVNQSCSDSKVDFFDSCTRIVAATLGVAF